MSNQGDDIFYAFPVGEFMLNLTKYESVITRIYTIP